MRKIITIISIVLIVLYLSLSLLWYKKPTKQNTVTFASWGSQSELRILQEIISDFEKESNINVNFLHIPQNYFQKLHLLYASNKEPDIIFINNQNIPLYIEAGLLEDLNEYFPNAENTFNNEAINCFKKEEKLYAIPRDISNLVLYYNNDIFKNKNIKIPEKINNLKQLKELSLEIKKTNIWALNYEEDPLFWLYYLAANGGGVISDNKYELIINKEESLSALNFYSDLINKYHLIPTKAEVGSMTSAQMFMNGKLAMYLGGRWMFPIFSETITFNWDTIPFPSDSQNKLYIDSSGWAISKNSKKKEESAKLIAFLSSKKSSIKFTESGLIVPARKDTMETFLKKDKKNKAFIKMLNNAKPTPVNKNYRKINDILKEKSQTIFTQNTKAQNVFNNKTIKELESLL